MWFEYGVQKKGFAGMKADSGDNDRVESHLAGEDLPFGVFVAIDPTDNKIYIPQANDTRVRIGITVHSHGIVTDGYKKGDTVSVMVHGAIWAKTSNSDAWTPRIGLPAQFENGTGFVSDKTGGFQKGRVLDVEQGLVQVLLSQ